MGFEFGEHKKRIGDKLAIMNPYSGYDGIESTLVRDTRDFLDSNENLGFFPAHGAHLLDLSGDYSKATGFELLMLNSEEEGDYCLDHQRFNIVGNCSGFSKYEKVGKRDAYYSAIKYRENLFIPLFTRKIDASEVSDWSHCAGKDIICMDKKTFSNFEESPAFILNSYIKQDKRFRESVYDEKEFGLTLQKFWDKGSGVHIKILDNLKERVEWYTDNLRYIDGSSRDLLILPDPSTVLLNRG